MTHWSLFAATAALAAGAPVHASFMPMTIDIYGTSGPDAVGSSTYAEWWNYAHGAVHAKQDTLGAGHGAYVELSDTGGQSAPQAAYNAAVTGFDSWQGAAGGSGELGHSVYFIFDIRSESYDPLSLSRISGIQIIEDAWAHSAQPLYATPIAFDLTTTLDPLGLVAYAYDGTLVTSGTIEAWDAAHWNNPIYEVIGTFRYTYPVNQGSGEPYYQSGDTPQQTLNRGLAHLGHNLRSWTGVATYDGQSVQTTVQFVPEPVTIVFLAVGTMLLSLRRQEA